MASVKIAVKSVEARWVVGVREVVPKQTLMRQRCIMLNNQAWALVQSYGLKTDGISVAIYYSNDNNGIDVEMAYGVQAPASTDLSKLHCLPAVQVAYAVYRGSYDDFGAVRAMHGSISAWIQNNGYRSNGATREWYLKPPTRPKDHAAVMEIQYPIG